MRKDKFSEPRTVVDASATEVGDANNSDIENIDSSATPWHMAAEDIISYVVTANASSSSADGIRTIKESQLDVTMKDTRTPDVCVALSDGVKIAGPIGEYLGPRSTIEYKSPADNCALDTVMRSGAEILGNYKLECCRGAIYFPSFMAKQNIAPYMVKMVPSSWRVIFLSVSCITKLTN